MSLGGSNNWVLTTAGVPATFYTSVQASEPGFVNRVGRDVHLTAASGCRNRGLDALVYLDGVWYSGLPASEYVNHLPLAHRQVPGRNPSWP